MSVSAPEPVREGAPGWSLLLWAAILIGLPMLVAALSVPLPQFSGPTEHARRRFAVTPPSAPPPVEPLDILDLAPTEARAVNAAIPFSTAPNPAARPFLFVGDALSQARAQDCLAAAQLYEAGDDATGQKAVAQVVLNRLRHPAFPKTVCGVVFEGAERATGCQFTFTCDGALGRTPAPAAWDRARDLARMMLSGTVDKPVGYATHYHTDWVVPYWSSSLDKITSVGSHLFFRWKGWWGTPGAFHRMVSGAEPVVAKLAFLSTAHRMGSGDGMAAPSGPVAEVAPDFSDLSRPAIAIGRERIGDRFGPGRLAALNSSGDAFVMLLDKGASPASFEQLARQLCSGRMRCRLLGWTRASDVPNAFPIDEETLALMSYAYMRSTGDGLERSLYNCKEFPGRPKEHCMRERAPVATPRPTLVLPATQLPGERSGTETVHVAP